MVSCTSFLNGRLLMNQYLAFDSPDSFDRLEVEPDEYDCWLVKGYNDSYPDRTRVVESGFPNKQLAETFVRLVLEKWIEKNYFSGWEDI